MDYSQLSDFEINRMVGDVIFKGLWACKPETSGNDTGKWYYGNADTTFVELKPLPNYCSKWAEAGPIIVANLIEVSPDYEFTDESEQELCATGLWTANHVEVDGKSYYQSHQNPLRSAMIVFLMMQAAKHA